MSIPDLKNYLSQLDESLILAESQQEKLEFLVELGKAYVCDKSLLKKPDFKVSGCASNTFVKVIKNEDNKISIVSATDSYVVAGYLFIFEMSLKNLDYVELNPAIIILKNWLHQNGFDTGIVPTRINASNRILEKIEELKPELN